MKTRATIDQQIESLQRRGITFDVMNEESARRFLTDSSYFYKLKSYRNNYPVVSSAIEGEYQYRGLDFGYLVELSNIDFALSRLVLSLSLGIEHAVKVRTNQLFMNDSDDDIAAKCVRRAFHGEPPRVHENPYTEELVAHCGGNYAAWQVWELDDFDAQTRLYKAYYALRNERESYGHMLHVVRKMRNAVSHGSCLLADVTRLAPTKKRTGRTDMQVTNAALRMCDRGLKKRGKRNSMLIESLDRLVVHNYAAVLVCHLEFVSSGKVLGHSALSVEELISRIERTRGEYFGDKGSPAERNRAINTTLDAIVQLSRGYVKKSKMSLP